ncbi:MAG: SRPBCC family protein [Desulfobacterales bacterium]|nr:SRPBCC family protein [Desulfobacterales bacterium]
MIIRESVTIRAPMESVWDVFSRIETWADWNPVCRQCRFETGARLAVGNCLSFELNLLRFPIRIVTEIKSYEKGRSVTWVGSKWGVKAEHTFTFEPVGEKVRLESIENFSGPMLIPAKLIGIPKRLHKLNRHLLVAIQKEAEK